MHIFTYQTRSSYLLNGSELLPLGLQDELNQKEQKTEDESDLMKTQRRPTGTIHVRNKTAEPPVGSFQQLVAERSHGSSLTL